MINLLGVYLFLSGFFVFCSCKVGIYELNVDELNVEFGINGLGRRWFRGI